MRSAVPGSPAAMCSLDSSSLTRTIECDARAQRYLLVLREHPSERSADPSARAADDREPRAQGPDATARLLRTTGRARLLTSGTGGRSFASRASPLPSPRMKEFLEGRRFGFALRPQLGQIALGLAVAVTVLDLMAWFGWGARDTNGFVIANAWLAVATPVFALLATITALPESRDAADEDRPLARLDLLAAFVVFVLYAP